ncbi:hypothetical protein DIPPA_23870, partial [Diplonema papillatum]
VIRKTKARWFGKTVATLAAAKADTEITVSWGNVIKTLRALPRGTAPGPSGLSAQHLLDLAWEAMWEGARHARPILAPGAQWTMLAAGLGMLLGLRRRRQPEGGTLERRPRRLRRRRGSRPGRRRPVSAYEREEAARRQEARYEGWGDPQAGPQVIWLDPHDLRGGGEPKATKKAQQQKRPPSRSAPGNNPECPSVREEACKVGGCPFKGTRDKLVHHLRWGE